MRFAGRGSRHTNDETLPLVSYCANIYGVFSINLNYGRVIKMIRILTVSLVIASFLIAYGSPEAVANSKSSSDLLKEGLLGAGAGAVGGAASGAKGGDLWKGALAGAGVNIVGGALLDSMSGEKVSTTQQVDRMDSRSAYSDGYQDGYSNGYKKGYTDGYKDGMKEAYSER